MISYRAAVVASHGIVTGIVGDDIVVIPNMSPRYTSDLLAAQAAVAEVGGALAHLATVSREHGKTMMVLRNACKILEPGMIVTLDPGRCEIRVDNCKANQTIKDI